MPPERSAGFIFFKETSRGIKYLVIRSSRADSSRPEHWDFPKGLLEKGESGMEAAGREAKEETGIEDFEIIPEFKETARYFTKHEGKTVLKFAAMFLARAENKRIKLSWEHDKYEWLSFSQAHKRISNSQMKKVLEKADEFLSRKSV